MNTGMNTVMFLCGSELSKGSREFAAYVKMIHNKFPMAKIKVVDYDCAKRPRFSAVDAVVVVAKGRVISRELYNIIKNCKKPMYFFGLMQLWAVEENRWLAKRCPKASMGVPMLVAFNKEDLKLVPGGNGIKITTAAGMDTELLWLLPAMVYNPAESEVRR